MKRILKAGSIIALAAMCVTLVTGCGESRAERKIGKEARYYIANKYGFRPQTIETELRHVGEMEGVWHKKDGGTATCEYNGRTFNVYVSLVNPKIRYDDYLRDDVEKYLATLFEKDLDCKRIHVWGTYGTPVCMIPGDVKNAEDVLTKCDNLQIYVSTYGLNRESAKGLDVTGFRNDTQINIIDWTSEECLEDEDLMRETVVGLESNSYTSGFSKIRLWYRYSDGDVNSLEK
jgi:hypothetical protein